jgi:colanic acid/amylovoran biosynthesis glycosyltransferase
VTPTRIAVVIPVRDEPTGLRRVLERIAAQDCPAGLVDVHVAVDGADPACVRVAEELGADVVTLDPSRGSYAARNAALERLADDVEVVVFTDGDCLPTARWLAAHLIALAAADMSGGAVEVTLRPHPHPAEFVDKVRHLRQEIYVAKDSYAATANLAVRREVVDAMRFDPTLQTGGDAEFGRRATAAGFRLVYTPDALVEHPARRTTAELMRKVARICGGMSDRAGYWRGREIPAPTWRRDIVRRALRDGVSRNPLWLLRMVALERRCQRRIVEAAVANGAVVQQASRPLTVGYVVDKAAELSQTFVTGEIEELRRQGVQVVLVAVREGNAAAPDVPLRVMHHDTGRRWSPRLHALAWQVAAPRRWRAMTQALRQVDSEVDGDGVPRRAIAPAAGWLLRHRVDVLHAHFAWRGAAAAMALAPLVRRPWSLTVHASDIVNDRRNLDAKLAAADRLVTVCDYNRTFLRDELGLSRDVDLVVCGVQLPAELALAAEVDVVAVGRLVEKKGFDLLLAALAEPRLRPLLRTVVVVGDGPLDEKLRKQSADLGLADVVRFAGAQPHDEALATIAKARVLCLPARIARNGDRDSMPVVVKEAMAAGVPVVATDVVGIPEMVDDTVGRLVPAEDVAALAAALAEMLGLPADARRALGAAARDRVAERFTMPAQVAGLRRILTELAGRPA